MKNLRYLLAGALILALLAIAGCGVSGLKTTVTPPHAIMRGQNQQTSAGETARVDVDPAAIYNVFVGQRGEISAPDPVFTHLNINGTDISAPSLGAAVRIFYSRAPATSATTQSADVAGAGMFSASSQAVSGFKTSLPPFAMPDEAGSVGGGNSAWRIRSIPVRAENILFYVAGLIFVVGAGVDFYFQRSIRAALSLGGVGLLLVGIGVIINIYPWLLAWAVGVAVLAALAYVYVRWFAPASLRAEIAKITPGFQGVDPLDNEAG